MLACRKDLPPTLGLAMLLFVTVQGACCYGEELSAELLEKIKQATVFVKVDFQPRGNTRGSGFFVAPNLLVTNAHVIGQLPERSRKSRRVEVVIRSGHQNGSCRIPNEIRTATALTPEMSDNARREKYCLR